MKKKMMILVIFPIAGNNGKYIKIYYDGKKKNKCRNRFGLLPKQYCEKKKMYCNAEFVL